jgi:hypothetical protein
LFNEDGKSEICFRVNRNPLTENRQQEKGNSLGVDFEEIFTLKLIFT